MGELKEGVVVVEAGNEVNLADFGCCLTCFTIL